MWFRTKKEVLEYLGKDCKDVRYVNRKVAKGEIKEVDGGYELVDIQGDRLRELEEENKNLKARVKELEEVCKDSLFGDKDDDLNTATVQWHYYEDLYNQEVADKEKRIEKAFRWIKMIKPTAKKEEFYEWIMSDEE